MKKENKFGLAAIKAVTYGNNPVDSWGIAAQEVFKSKSSQEKSCPKNAFLGLCEAGLVKGIKSGNYLKWKKENLNKKYAITAVKLLATNPSLTKNELWNEVREKLFLGDKKHNSQMDVVLALWKKTLIQLK